MAARRICRIIAPPVLLLLAACAAPEPVKAPAVMAPPPPPPPPPPAVVVVPTAPVPPPVVNFAAHIASYKTRAEAEAAWPRLLRQVPAITDVPRRYIDTTPAGQAGPVVRLLVGEFVERNDAVAFCRQLQASNLYCAPHALGPGAAG